MESLGSHCPRRLGGGSVSLQGAVPETPPPSSARHGARLRVPGASPAAAAPPARSPARPMSPTGTASGCPDRRSGSPASTRRNGISPRGIGDGYWFAHGKRVKSALIRKIGGRRVRVEVEEYDRFGRGDRRRNLRRVRHRRMAGPGKATRSPPTASATGMSSARRAVPGAACGRMLVTSIRGRGGAGGRGASETGCEGSPPLSRRRARRHAARPAPTRRPPAMLPDLAAIEAAAETVHAVMPPTPAHRWPLLAARTGAEVWVKHENQHPHRPRSRSGAGWSTWTGCAAGTRTSGALSRRRGAISARASPSPGA